MAIEMEKGSVSIDAQNIMPVIKRWLYSDKDIFLREVVSNGCDAITKYRMLNPGTEEPMSVTVSVDKDNKTIAISDTGIGMTADEVRRYINQVAFSSSAMCRMMVVPWSLRQPGVMVKVMPSAEAQCTGSAPSW